MKHKVVYSCRHVAFVHLYGKSSEREQKVEDFRNMLCVDCLKAQNLKKAIEIESQYDIHAPLEGTAAQIDFARVIRAKTWLKLLQLVNNGRMKDGEQFLLASRKYLANIDAKFWIDRKDAYADSLIADIEYYKDSRL